MKPAEKAVDDATRAAGHSPLWCGGAWECFRCGASGSVHTDPRLVVACGAARCSGCSGRHPGEPCPDRPEGNDDGWGDVAR
jgi:hypothetical protein